MRLVQLFTYLEKNELDSCLTTCEYMLILEQNQKCRAS